MGGCGGQGWAGSAQTSALQTLPGRAASPEVKVEREAGERAPDPSAAFPSAWARIEIFSSSPTGPSTTQSTDKHK